MAGSISFFIVSVLGMSALLFSNGYWSRKEALFQKSDAMIMRWIAEGKRMIHFINMKTFGLFIHYLLEELEMFSSKVFKKLKSVVKK